MSSQRNASVPAEPRELALRVAPRPALDELDGLLDRRRAGEDLEQLLVADRLTGRHVPGEPSLRERAHLVEQPCGHHLVHAGVDARIERLAGPAKPPYQGVVVRQALAQPLVVTGVGDPLVGHLQGTDDAPHVVGVDERGALGVALGEKRVQGLGAPLGGHPLVGRTGTPVLLAGGETTSRRSRRRDRAPCPRRGRACAPRGAGRRRRPARLAGTAGPSSPRRRPRRPP